ncbi:hypothetical protein [Trinickia mobilis]|uniref:hypothetical protein n=1 Tax=Trinickia mobilis TaxID=2816356 RepID=UPI001A8C8947|nr:hypothetical protein [Trinickia mobilis]
MYVDLGKGRFIIDAASDPYALSAMQSYADACELTVPDLASALRHRLGILYTRSASGDAMWRWLAVAQEYAKSLPDYSEASWQQVRSALAAVAQAGGTESVALMERAPVDLGSPAGF